MKRIVIAGASGFGREAAWIIERINRVSPTFEILGFCDDDAAKQAGMCGAYPLLGPVETVVAHVGKVGFFCAVGDNRARQQLTQRARIAGCDPFTLIDPGAVVAPDVMLGLGCYVGIGSVVSVGSKIGDGVLINHQVCVGHDVTMGGFSQACPGVCVSGGCSIGEGALLGTNAGVIPLKTIGAWSTVGAGSMAMRDVAEGAALVRLSSR